MRTPCDADLGLYRSSAARAPITTVSTPQATNIATMMVPAVNCELLSCRDLPPDASVVEDDRYTTSVAGAAVEDEPALRLKVGTRESNDAGSGASDARDEGLGGRSRAKGGQSVAARCRWRAWMREERVR